MPYTKSTPFTASLLLSLMSASTCVTADHNNTLIRYNAIDESEKSISSEKEHCEQSGASEESEPLCKEGSSDKPAFDVEPILSISNQVDIRPENCFSFFDDYLHTRRGLRIESALSSTEQFNRYEETVATFPVLDFISTRRGHVVKSKDISSLIYTSESDGRPLYDSIMEDAKEIETRIFNVLESEGEISAKVHRESTKVTSGDLTDITLHIIIQAGMASNDQINQIKLAASDIEKQWRFKLEIIEIP